MKLRDQILDVLNNSGPKKLIDLIRILEEFDPKNARSDHGVKPIQAMVLQMLNRRELAVGPDYYLRVL